MKTYKIIEHELSLNEYTVEAENEQDARETYWEACDHTNLSTKVLEIEVMEQ